MTGGICSGLGSAPQRKPHRRYDNCMVSDCNRSTAAAAILVRDNKADECVSPPYLLHQLLWPLIRW